MRLLKPLDISEGELQRLYKIKIGSHKKQVIKKTEVILSYNETMDIKKIKNITGVSRKTIFNYVKEYKKNKNFMFSKKGMRRKQYLSKLGKQQDMIIENFKKNPVRTYKEAVLRIKKTLGLTISEAGIYKFLKNHNFYKNKDGYYVQKQQKKINKKKIGFSYLLDNKDLIIQYMESNPTADETVALNRIRRQFPLTKEIEDYKIISFLSDYWNF